MDIVELKESDEEVKFLECQLKRNLSQFFLFLRFITNICFLRPSTYFDVFSGPEPQLKVDLQHRLQISRELVTETVDLVLRRSQYIEFPINHINKSGTIDQKRL